ncbi:MAG: hypothetical protein JRF50_12930 [Deltaproteobacteria bacterium]|nr:hypothetical protein [Deltaproteobacteria bacterium]
MRINAFLTDLAQSYNPKIEYVAFCDLSGRLGGVRKGEGFETYRIDIDQKKLPCLYFVFFVFFHEVGHILFKHSTHADFFNCNEVRIAAEAAADIFALHEMGLVDDQGRDNEEFEICIRCYKTRSMKCLKESNIQATRKKKEIR